MIPHLATTTRPARLYLFGIALLVTLFLCASMARVAHAEEDDTTVYDNNVTAAAIQRLFPKATVIGEKDPNLKVYPVYQLQELLGYAFESNDFVDIKGFSGDRINLLLGLTTAGIIQDLQLLKHHEPIFMHGLGPKPFLAFLDQYRGISLRDQIILGGNSSDAPAGAKTFDGITKATVSVIVANDTLLSAAREAARLTLPEYAQQSTSVLRDDYFREMSVRELLSGNMLAKWELAVDELESELGYLLEDYPEFSGLDVSPDDNAVRLFYSYVNAPVIGKNLLGDTLYTRVMQYLEAGEHAIVVASEGPVSSLEPEFRPGTIPQRLTVTQHGLPVGIRDMNIAVEQLPTTLLESGVISNNSKLMFFKIRAQSGFDPASPIDVSLNFTLHKNPLVRDTASFTNRFQLPEQLFSTREVTQAARKAPWLTLWQSRTTDITILGISLLVVTVVFAKQRQLRRHARLYPAFRLVFLIFTLFFIGFHAQGQLSVVNIYTLLLALRDGFSLDVFLLDPAIFILWSFTFVSLFIWGRGLFCGWLCPFGALQELLAKLAKILRIPQFRPSPALNRKLILIKYPLLVGLVGVSLVSLSAAEKMAEIEPFKTSITLVFIREWPFVVYAIVILAVGLFIQKAYCRYLCPLGAGLAVLGRLRRLEWLDRRQACGSPCQLCRHRCQVDAIDKAGKIDYDECVQCLECVVILDDPQQCAPERSARKRAANTGFTDAVTPLKLL